MDESRRIAVSPRHHVRLAAEYVPLLDRAPQNDFVVRTIERREANGLPLMSAEIAIASALTRQHHPLAYTYPLHFRKTYFASSLHVHPRIEFERCAEASQLLDGPPPIGFEDRVFRSCLIPGVPYTRISPFGFEPEESNLPRAAELALPTAAGLWRFIEDAADQLRILHKGGFAHGDMELHNLIVCPAPLEIVMVDFEAAVREQDVEPAEWAKRREEDFAALLREAVLLQCALGRQHSELAEHAFEQIPRLFRNPERFRQTIMLRPD